MRCRGKKVVNAVSGKRTSWALSLEAEWRRVIIRVMTSERLVRRWMGPSWAAATLSVRGILRDWFICSSTEFP